MKIVENVKRRHFLIGSAGTMAAVAVGVPVMAQSGQEPLPEYVAWKDAKDMIVHSKQTLETKRAAQGSELITPTTELYIRNNLPAPSDKIVADRDAWEVVIEGVANPGTMTLGALKTLGLCAPVLGQRTRVFRSRDQRFSVVRGCCGQRRMDRCAGTRRDRRDGGREC